MENINEEDYLSSLEGPTSNPFTGSFDVNLIRTHIVNPIGLPDYFDIEQQSKISIYKNSEVAVLVCRDGKPITSKLYLYIIYELLKPNKDWIEINFKEVQSRLDISRASLYTGIGELENFKIITRKKGRNLYWINTEYLFNGNRITYMEINAKHRLKIVRHRTIQS